MSRSEESLVRGYTGRVLFVVAMGTMLSYLSRLVLSPLLPTIIDEVGVSPSAAGFALSVMWFLVAVGQYPGGRFSDKLSRTTVLVIGLGILAVGLGLLAGVRTYAMFIAATALVGLGGGLYLPAGFAFLSDLFVARRGQAFGINAGSVDVSGVIAGPLAIGVLAVTTWRTAFFPVLAGVVVTLALLHAWSREPYILRRVDHKIPETFRRITTTSQMLRILLAFSLSAFVWQSVTSFLPMFLLAQGFSDSVATSAFMALFVVGVVIRPVAGGAGDRVGHLWVAVAASVSATAGLVVTVVAPSIPLLIFGVLLMAAGLAAIWPVMNAYVMDLFPVANMGGDFGATRTVFMGIGSIGPLTVGVVADVMTFSMAFLGLALCLLASTAILVLCALEPR